MVSLIRKHTSEVISLAWSTNNSYEQMQRSDASSVYLSSTSVGQDLAVWRLSDMSYHDYSQQRLATPLMYDNELFNSAVKAVAWSPNHEGVLATGGGLGD